MARQRQNDRKPKRRDLAKESHWRKHVAPQEESGLAVHAYCQGEGLSESCFYWWKREIAKRDRETHASRQKKPAPARFAEVRVIAGSSEGAYCEDQDQSIAEPKPDPTGATGVEVFLSGGHRLRVFRNFDEPTFLRVVALLEGGRAC